MTRALRCSASLALFASTERPRGAAAWALGALLLWALPVAAQVPDWSLQARQRLIGGADSARAGELAERAVWLARGEALLLAGDAEAAEQAFDRAALLLHAPDTESSLVRSYMQAGHYRRALAFAAHTAGAHREMPAATALYAWLLHAGGQTHIAAERLESALAASPRHPTLVAARAGLAQHWPLPGPELLQAPVRLAPYGTASLPVGLSVLATGTLIDSGQHALVPAAVLGEATEFWLRNGLGQTRRATLMTLWATLDVALLRLDAPLPLPASLRSALRAPHAGSPAYNVQFAFGPSTEAAWPLLRQGFMGRTLGTEELPLLGIDMPAGPGGGPVFDARGALVGMALPGRDGRARLMPLQALQVVVGDKFDAAPISGPSMPAAVDEVYETSLQVAVQLIGSAKQFLIRDIPQPSPV